MCQGSPDKGEGVVLHSLLVGCYTRVKYLVCLSSASHDLGNNTKQ